MLINRVDLNFILTEDCNLRCSYCYQPRFEPNELDVETALSAVRSALNSGIDTLSLTFFGGEPLLRAPEMFEILEKSRKMAIENDVPVTSKISTNGLLLNEDIVRHGDRLGLFFSLSLDGNRQAQDSARLDELGASSFDRVVHSLEILVKSEHPFAVYSVITPQNVEHLDASVRFLWDAGTRIIINTVDYTARWDDKALRKLDGQHTKLGRFYEDKLKRKSNFHLEPFDSRISHRTRADEWGACSAGVGQVTIGPDGTLYGCIEYFHRRLFPLGTVETWLDCDKVRALLVDKGGSNASCRQCGIRDRCNNTCACVNLRGTDSAKSPSQTVCSAEQVTILAVDKVARRLFRKKNPEFILRQYSCSFHALTTIERLIDEMEVRP